MLYEITKDFPNNLICNEHGICISLNPTTCQEKIKDLTDSFGTANVNLLGAEDLAQVIKALLKTE